MRQIGHLANDKDARTFGDYLYVQGIENEAERDGDRWAIWVHSDDQLDAARKLLAEFQASPADPKYLAGSPAEKLREQRESEDAAYQKRMIKGRSIFPGLVSYGFGPLTYALIAGCVVVFFISSMGRDKVAISGLFITGLEVEGGFIRWSEGLKEIRAGQVWRLVSPILIHFGIGHIFFNMWWLRDLGSMFEARLRTWYFALFVIVIAIASNLGQYLQTGVPVFGGMSGVVYGLIGYVWVRGRFDPAAGLFLDRQSVIWALIWFVLCLTGLMGPIANTAHAVGLIGGAAWAYIDSKRR